MSPIDVAHAALVEAGRPDLAGMVVGFDDGGGFGFYLEVNEEMLSEADWAVVDRAETLARASVGLPPIDKRTVTA